jgi:hypothetical protein
MIRMACAPPRSAPRTVSSRREAGPNWRLPHSRTCRPAISAAAASSSSSVPRGCRRRSSDTAASSSWNAGARPLYHQAIRALRMVVLDSAACWLARQQNLPTPQPLLVLQLRNRKRRSRDAAPPLRGQSAMMRVGCLHETLPGVYKRGGRQAQHHCCTRSLTHWFYTAKLHVRGRGRPSLRSCTPAAGTRTGCPGAGCSSPHQRR